MYDSDTKNEIPNFSHHTVIFVVINYKKNIMLFRVNLNMVLQLNSQKAKTKLINNDVYLTVSTYVHWLASPLYGHSLQKHE